MSTKEPKTFPFLDNGITQVAWVVKDLDEAVKRFHDVTGIGPWHYYTYGAPLLSLMRRNGVDTEYRVATAVANSGPLRLELIQPLEGDTIFWEYIERCGYGGVQHFGVAVENMEEAVEQARRAGFTVTMEGRGHGLDGDGHFAYLDTEKALGITIELMERPRRRHTPEKVYPES